MKANRLIKEYENEMIQFLEFTRKNLPDDNEIFYCPCKICQNLKKHLSKDIFNYLGCDEIIQNYTKWV